jgi:hypothetical protein
MKASRSLKLCTLLLVFMSGLTFSVAQGADIANKKQIIQKARQAYCSLKSRGLIEFKVNVQPNWRLVLKDQIAADPKGAETALQLLNGIHFTLSFSPDGVVSVTHHADVAPPNPESAKGFDQIFAGMEQAMSGFFDTWKPFMFTSPFPEVDSLYHLEDTGTEYVLTYQEGTTGVTTKMSRELIIREMSIDAPNFKSTLKPQFAASPQGLLLTSYDATYSEPGGAAATLLNIRIDYQLASGQPLPSKLTLAGTYENNSFNMELGFINYTVKNK